MRAHATHRQLMEPEWGCRYEATTGSLSVTASSYRFTYPADKTAPIFWRHRGRQMMRGHAEGLSALLGRNVEIAFRNPLWFPGMPPAQELAGVLVGKFDPHRPPPAPFAPWWLAGMVYDLREGVWTASFARCRLRFGGDVPRPVVAEFAGLWWFKISEGACVAEQGWLLKDGNALVYVISPAMSGRLSGSTVEGFSEPARYLARHFERDFVFAFAKRNWPEGSVPTPRNARLVKVSYVAPEDGDDP